MSYKWVKKGSIDLGGDTICPKVGSDVTKLANGLEDSVRDSLIDNGFIVDARLELEEAEKEKSKIEAAVNRAKVKAEKARLKAEKAEKVGKK